MPYAFPLPTTSALSYLGFFESPSHPSLTTTATTHRSVLRNALKKHKRLQLPLQNSNLSTVLSALLDYIPYLGALDAGLAGKLVSEEEIDVVLLTDVEVEWRSCLAPLIPGRDAPRVRGRGLDYEICSVLNTLAYTYTLLARVQLLSLYAPITPSPERRSAAVTNAIRYLLQANSLHAYLFSRTNDFELPAAALDVRGTTQSALAFLALSEATIFAVLKDDLYPALVAQDRNKNDKEWMIKAPVIPKVRVSLFARLSLAACEHARRAHALLSSPGNDKSDTVDGSLIRYTKSLQKTSRAKACRFLAIEAELDGKAGEAIAWLIAGKKELGFKIDEDENFKLKALSKFKKDWKERQEDKRIEKGAGWGSDAGGLEELRVIEMLEKKWNKENDLITHQIIPPSESLIAAMPSGREIHSPKVYIRPNLDPDTLASMRAPPDRDKDTLGSSSESDGSRGEISNTGAVPGAFPDTSSAKNSYNY
ncbi:hypothetical protein MMC13_002927 [Lambiella insularis]|nr:hypothetical protein [Lambiella insularis]